MMTENIRALVTYRLEQAVESLEAARILLDKNLIINIIRINSI